VKLGTENKKETIVAGALVLVAALLLVHTFTGKGQDASPEAQIAPEQSGHKALHSLLSHSLDPSLRFDLLKSSEDVTYKGTGRNIFSSVAPPPDIPTPLPPDKQPGDANAPSAPPPPPPIDLKFYGFAGPRYGSKSIFLLKGEDIFLAKEGDIVDRRYKIMRIGPTSVEIQDVLTNNTQTIPLSAG